MQCQPMTWEHFFFKSDGLTFLLLSSVVCVFDLCHNSHENGFFFTLSRSWPTSELVEKKLEKLEIGVRWDEVTIQFEREKVLASGHQMMMRSKSTKTYLFKSHADDKEVNVAQRGNCHIAKRIGCTQPWIYQIDRKEYYNHLRFT